jgi:hypothetical protein
VTRRSPALLRSRNNLRNAEQNINSPIKFADEVDHVHGFFVRLGCCARLSIQRRLSLARMRNRYWDNLPSKNNTGSSQRGRLRMPKNDNVFRLKCDDEVLAVAANGYLPAKGTVALKSCGH